MTTTIETGKLRALMSEREALLKAGRPAGEGRYGPHYDALQRLGVEIWREEKRVAEETLAAENAVRDAATQQREEHEAIVSAARKSSRQRTGRVVFEASADWLEIVDRTGQIGYAIGTLEEQLAAERIVGLADRDWEEPVAATRVAEIDERHSAIHPGDLLVTTSQHGYTTGVWFVRLAIA
jgi:hypothetical protein